MFILFAILLLPQRVFPIRKGASRRIGSMAMSSLFACRLLTLGHLCWVAVAARPLGMQDLRMVAEDAVSAADAFVATAKQAPTASDVAADISHADAGTTASLKVSGVPVALRGASAAGFVQLSNAVAPTAVANLRLVEPSSRALNAAVVLGNGMSDALAALEDRQRADDAMYRSLIASSGALVRETRGVPT